MGTTEEQPSSEKEIIKRIRSELGRKGGLSRSLLKAEVARLNGSSKTLNKEVYQQRLEEIRRKYRREI
jgi:hypothetical protein